MNHISEELKDQLNSIPALPGIYKMIDSQGVIIYIGKSICLKNRVRYYFTGKSKRRKVDKMIGLVKDIEYEVTDTNLEARIKECILIKRFQPIFNSQFKNHKKYIYITIEETNGPNPLTISYNRKNNSYGPIRSKSITARLIDELKNLYPITKIDSKYNFNYNILPISMDINELDKTKDSLKQMFAEENYFHIFINQLKDNMKEAAKQLKFETASYYKEVLRNFNYVKRNIFRYKDIYTKQILLKIPIQMGYKLFFVTKGEIILSKVYSKLDNKQIKEFIKRAKGLVPLNMKNEDEKAVLDLIDIIYSEIESLPKDMVMIV